MIQDITQRLNKLTSLISTAGSIGAEQGYIIAKFFRDFGDTNAVITEAVKMAELDAECDKFKSVYDKASTENILLYN